MPEYKIFRIIIGGVLYLCDKYTIEDVKAKAERALKRGRVVRWEDGRQQFITYEVVFDPNKSDQGSEAYEWDKSGNKVKHKRFLITQYPDKRPSDKEFLGTVYKDWE